MKSPLPRQMAEATRLTRSGKLTEATALIRSLLTAQPPPSSPDLDPPIEGTFERVAPYRTPRSPLRETLQRIAAGGMPIQNRTVGHPGDLPPGAAFTTQTVTGPTGTRDYKLYRPAAADAAAPRSLPLVILLHGCTQSPDDFAAGTGMNRLADEMGFLVAYPAQPAAANANRCWNWFNPADQSRDSGEPALIAAITRQVLSDPSVDPARVYVAGLSAGGAATAIMAQSYPDLFAAAGVHSGLPVGAAHDVASAFGAMRSGAAGRPASNPVPMIVFHGDADTTVNPANGTAVLRQSLAALSGLTPKTRSGKTPQGRAYRQTRHLGADGRSFAELWSVAGMGHAWSGGDASGSYTDPTGPDASREMLRFFLQHRRG